MKIRTKEALVDRVEQDLAWRKKELTTLRNAVHVARPRILPTALRAASVLLYAHWEGFIKNSTQYYLNYVRYQGLSLNEVNTSILALCLKQKISGFKETNKAKLHVEFVEYFQSNMTDRAEFSESNSINTGSNLNSHILREIYSTIGLDVSPYELKFNLIDQQLLKNRNEIAHGSEPPLTKEEYNLLHSQIVDMISHVRTDVCNAASMNMFRKNA